MFRRWSTILGPQALETDDPMAVAALDADVIMTAAILGFSAGRLAVGHPVEFAVDNLDKDVKLPLLRNTVAKINRALGDYKFKGRVAATITQPWHKGAVITGAAGSSKTPFNRRHVTEFEPIDLKLKSIAARTADDDKDPIGYQGQGAYTGFIVDPIHPKPGIQSTVRYNVPVDGYGSRWVPPRYQYRDRETSDVVHDQTDSPWGLINGADELPKDMVRQEVGLDPEAGNVVGYTHGMIQAIYLATQRGPWCTPFEIAAGNVTTKLASCFTCSLFMYAAGFPPSAIHIGQGNSWVPLYEKGPASHDAHAAMPMFDPAPLINHNVNGDRASMSRKGKEKITQGDDLASERTPLLTKAKAKVDIEVEDEDEVTPEILDNFVTHRHDPETSANFHTMVAALNNRWRLECRQHLLLGVEILQQNAMAAVNPSHRPRLARLAEVLEVIARDGDLFGAANLILDAVTIHDHESARVDRTLR